MAETQAHSQAMNKSEFQLSMIQARQAGGAEVADLLHQYRNYLSLLARLRLGQHLQTKVDASDLVQETLLSAWRSFDAFRGQSEAELMQWLRRILAHTAAGAVRHHRAAKRDLTLERRLEQEFNQSSRLLDVSLMGREQSPSQDAMRRERARQLADAIAELPPDYRDVIILRHFQGMTLQQIANRMERSDNSIQKLWARALVRLHQLLKNLA